MQIAVCALRWLGTREPTPAVVVSKPLIALHMLNASDFGSGARCRVILTLSAADRGRTRVGRAEADREQRATQRAIEGVSSRPIPADRGGTHPAPRFVF